VRRHITRRCGNQQNRNSQERTTLPGPSRLTVSQSTSLTTKSLHHKLACLIPLSVAYVQILTSAIACFSYSLLVLSSCSITSHCPHWLVDGACLSCLSLIICSFSPSSSICTWLLQKWQVYFMVVSLKQSAWCTLSRLLVTLPLPDVSTTTPNMSMYLFPLLLCHYSVLLAFVYLLYAWISSCSFCDDPVGLHL